jgi:hypothetical protein
MVAGHGNRNGLIGVCRQLRSEAVREQGLLRRTLGPGQDLHEPLLGW